MREPPLPWLYGGLQSGFDHRRVNARSRAVVDYGPLDCPQRIQTAARRVLPPLAARYDLDLPVAALGHQVAMGVDALPGSY